jgi:tRNA A-37 threonylcarbamoyl transferase component Bud32
MNDQDRRLRGGTADLAPTVVLRGSQAGVGPHSLRVAIDAGSNPGLADEINALLRERLRAAALFLAAGLCLALVRDVLFGGGLAWPPQVAAILSLACAFTLLSAPRSPSARGLKVAELAIFGLAAAVLAMRQYHSLLSWADRGDEASLVATTKDMMIGSIILVFGYAMLIPNTWRGACPFVLGIAAGPIAVDALLFLTHPDAFRLARRLATAQRAGQNAFLMTAVAALASYGAHLVNALRVGGMKARQLNQYRLRERIGAGGMGEVYLAEHRFLKRPCALKLIRPDRTDDPRSLARFEIEVRAMASLSDPHTVEVYDYGHAEDGTFYYVMEYLPGLSLEELASLHGPLPGGRVIFLLRQACEALAEAHAAGLIHRDLKPANLFAARRGGRHDFVKLLDFGLVKDTAEPGPVGLSREGTVRGTPQYMAPEQVTGDRPLDHRCDLYALGGVAYTLLTGHPPFEADTATRMMIAHVHTPVVPPSQLCPDVPPDLEQVVLRCLAKDPADRPQTAEELGRALASCSAAGQWDARQAAAWWQQFGPGSIAT